MMRVTQIESSATGCCLRLEGRLTERAVGDLEAECRALLARLGSGSQAGGGLSLDLSGLQFSDAAGVSLLRRLESAGARLEGRSPLLDALLDAGGPTPSAGTAISDEELLRRLRLGDGDAFETLVRSHGGRLLSVARRMLAVEEDARDVVQEAFLSACRSLPSFAGGSQLSTWLHRIVVNAALMKLRSRRRRPEDSIEDLLPGFAADGHFAEPVSVWHESTDAMLERRETRELVRRAIAQLPDLYRAVLILRDIEDCDTDETAVALGISPNAVKTRLHRARQALRTILDRELSSR